MNKEKPSGKFLRNTSCTCGSRHGKAEYLLEDGRIDGHCFACGLYYPPEGQVERKEIKQRQTYMKDINSIPSLPVLAIPDRKIKKETAQLYDVHMEVSKEDGKTITAHFYPDRRDGEIVGYEVKQVIDKQFSALGDRKGDLDLWGSHLPKTGKKLFITEGRLDAMSLYQVIVENTPQKYLQYTPSVVSLTRGASGAVKDLIASRGFVEGFEEVVLCFDMDDAGKKATQEVLKTFPMFKVAHYPLKDASDMLMADKGKELYQACVWNASVVRQGQVVDVHDFIEKAMEKPKMGLTFPWATVTKACFGIRPHTIHCIGAAPKIG